MHVNIHTLLYAYHRQVWMYKQADFNKLNTILCVRNRLRKKARQSNKLGDFLKFKKARNMVNNIKKYAISN